MTFSKPAAAPIAIATIFPTLSIIAVVGRFWARRRRKIPYKADDWMVIAALIACICNAVTLFVAATHGELGKKQPLDPDGNPYPNPALETFQKESSLYANEITGQVAITLCRAAVLLLLSRIFFVQTHFLFFSRSIQAINVAWGVSFLFIYIFQCWPIESVWKKTYGIRKHCVDDGTILWRSIAVTSLAIDTAILVLPLPYIFKLRLPRREKWGVAGIFMTGVFALTAAIGKTWNFFVVGELIKHDHQITYNESALLYWNVPEMCLAVVCACLPTMKGALGDVSLKSLVQNVKSSFSTSSEVPSTPRSTGSSKISRQGSDDLRPMNPCDDLSFETTPWGHGTDVERGNLRQ